VRALILIASSVLVALAGLLIYELRAGARPHDVAVATPPVPQAEPATPAALPPPLPDARPQIRRAIEAIAPTLETPRDLDRYVESVEQRARREHRLAAVDVEPAFEAIRRMRSQIGAERAMQLQAQYIEKLNRLSAEIELR
jgi:hypothetical protein